MLPANEFGEEQTLFSKLTSSPQRFLMGVGPLRFRESKRDLRRFSSSQTTLSDRDELGGEASKAVGNQLALPRNQGGVESPANPCLQKRSAALELCLAESSACARGAPPCGPLPRDFDLLRQTGNVVPASTRSRRTPAQTSTHTKIGREQRRRRNLLGAPACLFRVYDREIRGMTRSVRQKLTHRVAPIRGGRELVPAIAMTVGGAIVGGRRLLRASSARRRQEKYQDGCCRY